MKDITEINEGIDENDLKTFLFDDSENVSVSEFSKKIINWHELSRHLSGNGQNIRPNKIPKKYQKKINRFLRIIDILFGS